MHTHTHHAHTRTLTHTYIYTHHAPCTCTHPPPLSDMFRAVMDINPEPSESTSDTPGDLVPAQTWAFQTLSAESAGPREELNCRDGSILGSNTLTNLISKTQSGGAPATLAHSDQPPETVCRGKPTLQTTSQETPACIWL